MKVWIKVLKPIKDLYGVDSIVKEQLARVIDWENAELVERVKTPDNGKSVLKPYKATTTKSK